MRNSTLMSKKKKFYSVKSVSLTVFVKSKFLMVQYSVRVNVKLCILAVEESVSVYMTKYEMASDSYGIQVLDNDVTTCAPLTDFG